MRVKHHDLEIPIEKPFANCKLGREPYGNILTDIVTNYEEGFVLAINNEWGTGKTTFVKMWKQHLENKGFRTVYFNAWENDFDNNPLVALMSELRPLGLGKTGGEKIFKSVIEKGAVLVRNVAPSLAKALINKYVVNLDDVSDASIENSAKAATEILEDEIKEYAVKKKTISEFRSELQKFIARTDDKKPIVFIVDELDRCRPNYAVEVLEQMKHFFSIRGIIFVLSIDKRHLASSVKGFYGSEQIDANEYLRRFIDLEYSIPKPSTGAFCNYLFNYYAFGEFFYSPERKNYSEFQNDGDSLLKIAEILFQRCSATLRQQEKIFGQTRLILAAFEPNQYTFAHLLFILVFIKTMHSEIYRKIENNELTVQELSSSFADLIPSSEIKNPNGLNLIYIEALLLHFYNNSHNYENRIKLVESNANGDLVSPIMSNIETNAQHSELARCLKQISQWRYDTVSLKYLISRINLTERIIIK